MSHTPLWVWGTTVFVLCLLWCVVAWFRGPQRAIGCQVILSCLVPTWAQVDLADSLWLDCRVAATIFGLVAYCFHRQATFPWKLGWLDASMLCLLAIHVASDLQISGWSWAIPLRAYGEWCIAYIAGRLALQSSDDLRKLAPLGVTVAVIMALESVFEGVTGTHPWEWIYGERKFDGITRDMTRWFGLTRAWGCCAHPVYFGFVQVIFLPWLLRAWHRRDVKNFKKAFIEAMLPFLGAAGVFCTGSRAALAAYVLVMLLGLVAYLPWTRIPAAVLTVVFISVAIYNRDQVIDTVTRLGERINIHKTITIDGAEKPMTFTATRWYIVKVYWPAMERAPLLGYGTDAISVFPVKVPLGDIDPKAIKEVPYIDNQYVLMVLRFGWVGAAVFAIALLLAASAWFQRSTTMQFSHAAISFYVGGMILAVAAGLLTVWMPHDIGFPLLWWMGAGSSTPKRKPKSPKVMV